MVPACLAPLVGVLKTYTELQHKHNRRRTEYNSHVLDLSSLLHGASSRRRPSDPQHLQPPPQVHTSDIWDWETQLLSQLQFLLPRLAPALPREDEPSLCMVARPQGCDAWEHAGAGEQQDVQRGVDVEEVHAVELGGLLLRLKAIRVAVKAARAANEGLQHLWMAAQCYGVEEAWLPPGGGEPAGFV